MLNAASTFQGDILRGTKKSAVPSIYPDASLSTHFCFVLGDLNFRTRYKGRIKYDEQIDDVNKLVLSENWKELNHYDELRMALEKQDCLAGKIIQNTAIGLLS